MPLLLKDCKDSNQVIVTIATLSAITHSLKIIVFISLGFVFIDYLLIITIMIIGAVIGSYLGTRIRKQINSKKLLSFMKILLTLLALKSIYITLF
mgnify:CR=1 FL=1